MLKYITRILKAIIELGTQECQELAEILLRDLVTIHFGILLQSLDAIAFVERFDGKTVLANEITKAIKNMSKIYSVNRVESFIYEKESHYDGFYDYRDEEAAFESYMDSLDRLHEEENK